MYENDTQIIDELVRRFVDGGETEMMNAIGDRLDREIECDSALKEYMDSQ